MEGTRLSKGHAIVFAWEDLIYFVCISENRTKMGVMESLGVDGLLSDVQRMDKRQVSWKKDGFSWEGIVLIEAFFSFRLLLRCGAVFLPGFELRNDRFLGADDLEGIDGRDRK